MKKAKTSEFKGFKKKLEALARSFSLKKFPTVVYHWGCEDTDMYKRTKEKGYLVIKIPEHGLIYDKDLKKPDESYYNNKNIYKEPEPISPLSYLVESEAFIERLWGYVRKQLLNNGIKGPCY